MRNIQMIATIVLLYGVGGAWPGNALVVADGQTSRVEARVQTLTLAVDNMTCALCPVTVRKAMQSVAGVESVSIDLDAGTATVSFDPSVAGPEQIARASANAGYPARRAKPE